MAQNDHKPRASSFTPSYDQHVSSKTIYIMYTFDTSRTLEDPPTK